ncbi:MAG: HlyD family efflux transporter periplasmic adaptor subunit [Actinomycetota bacterium]|nr:HlyD family efflux transporter periplasmic adaptor subunit [Actinomycetota bacterium]
MSEEHEPAGGAPSATREAEAPAPSAPVGGPGGAGLFRQQALQKLSVREALDSALRITSGPLWVALAACLLAVGAALAWAIAGQAPTTVSAVGVLLPSAGVIEVHSTATGVVSNMAVGVGVQVAAGQEIATVIGPNGKAMDVDSAVAGTIDEQFVSQGSFVGIGTPIAELLPSDSPLSGVMFVSGAAGKVVQVGMRVDVSPSTAPASQYGTIKGIVNFVSPLPVTQQNVVSLVGERQGLVGLVSKLGTALEVDVTLERNPNTASGYEWSSGSGPDFPITPGTILSGSVRVASEAPIKSAF